MKNIRGEKAGVALKPPHPVPRNSTMPTIPNDLIMKPALTKTTIFPLDGLAKIILHVVLVKNSPNQRLSASTRGSAAPDETTDRQEAIPTAWATPMAASVLMIFGRVFFKSATTLGSIDRCSPPPIQRASIDDESAAGRWLFGRPASLNQ